MPANYDLVEFHVSAYNHNESPGHLEFPTIQEIVIVCLRVGFVFNQRSQINIADFLN